MRSWLRSLSVGWAWSFAILGITNYLNLIRRPACFDCAFPRGVPFTLFYDYGFFNGGIQWSGVLADILFATVSGALLGGSFLSFARRAGDQANTFSAGEGSFRSSWRERQIDEAPNRYDPGVTKFPRRSKSLSLADDEVRLCGGSAFEDAVVVGVFFNDMQGFGRGDVMTHCEQFAPYILEHIPVPLELIAEHAVRIGHYRVRNVDADPSGPRVADNHSRRTAEMQRPDIDAGVERGADHCPVKLNGCAAQLGIRL